MTLLAGSSIYFSLRAVFLLRLVHSSNDDQGKVFPGVALTNFKVIMIGNCGVLGLEFSATFNIRTKDDY